MSRLLWEIGKRRLTEAGFYVEKHGSELKVWKTGAPFPWSMRIESGKVSERTVNSIIRKAG